MDEVRAVGSSLVDEFEFAKEAILRKREDLKNLLETRDAQLADRVLDLRSRILDEVLAFVRTAVAAKQLSCRVTHVEFPYGPNSEDGRVRYLALQDVMNLFRKEPYNWTIGEKSQDNLLKAWQMGGKVENIKIDYQWDISCLLINV